MGKRRNQISADAPRVALIYTRVSSEEQGREGLSLPAQVAACRQYAVHQAWTLGGEFQDVLSGKRDDRRDYQALLTEARRLRAEGQVPVVVIAWLHRFGRRVSERVRAWEELDAIGVAIHSAHEGGHQSKLVHDILAAVAEEEARQIGDRVSTTWAHTTGLGWFKGGQPPFGYRWRPATSQERTEGAPRSVLEPSHAEGYARQAFERIAGGESTRSVARWLASLPLAVRTVERSAVFAARRKANGAEDKHGDLVTDLTWRTVQKMLRSPVYVGRPVDGDDDVLARPPARWAAIVPEDTWTRVQQRLERHTPISTRASQRYLLTAILRCPKCGRGMRGGSLPHSPRYRCGGDGRGLHCTQTAQRDLIEAAVLAEVGDLVEACVSDERVRAQLHLAWQKVAQPEAADATEIKRLEAEINRLGARRKDAGEYLLDGTMTKAAYAVAVAQVDESMLDIEEQLARLHTAEHTVALPPLEHVLAQLDNWTQMVQGADSMAKRELLAMLVESVVPIRVKRGSYAADITWTLLGEALREMSKTRLAA